MTAQHLAALGVLVGYALLCWFFLGRVKTNPPKASSIDNDAVLVAYASQSGQAEQLARQWANSLRQNQSVVLLTLNQVDNHLMEKTSTALFIVSTYGEGEPPDNALRFHQQWLRKGSSEKLSHLRFAVLALGDSQYQQFCNFGTSLTTSLQRHGAAPLFDTVTVDKMDTAHLATWQQRLSSHGLVRGQIAEAELQQQDFKKGLLIEQRCLNEGSPGDPAWFLRITPPPDTDWQAGDILQIQPYNDPSKPVREYSIASLPENGSIDLLVRQCRKEDGSFGLGSGWLIKESEPGSDVSLRIQRNPAFHAPAADKPMILIGNGTGIAGLRSHLKARAMAGCQQNCLFYGERTRAHDYFFQKEIENWQQRGFLPHLHLAFSRDQAEKRYVQDLLKEEAKLIADWAKQGAAIYVCGSLAGMASGVDEVLQAILGKETVRQMKIDGRYARDVY